MKIGSGEALFFFVDKKRIKSIIKGKLRRG